MILNNYWKWIKSVLTNNRMLADTLLQTDIFDISGTAIGMIIDCPSGDSGNKNKANSNCRLDMIPIMRVATGKVDATANSYSLGSTDITDSLSVSTATIQASIDSNLNRVISASFTNSTANDITIQTVGFGKGIYYAWNFSATKSVLFGIKELSEPVTIPAGQSKTISVDWIEA